MNCWEYLSNISAYFAESHRSFGEGGGGGGARPLHPPPRSAPGLGAIKTPWTWRLQKQTNEGLEKKKHILGDVTKVSCFLRWWSGMGKQHKRGQSVQQFSPKSPKCFRNLWMRFVSFKQTIIQLKSLSLLVQQLNLTLGGEGTAPECCWWAEGTKRSRKRKSTESRAHLLFYEWNEYHEQCAFPIRISSFLM